MIQRRMLLSPEPAPPVNRGEPFSTVGDQAGEFVDPLLNLLGFLRGDPFGVPLDQVGDSWGIRELLNSAVIVPHLDIVVSLDALLSANIARWLRLGLSCVDLVDSSSKVFTQESLELGPAAECPVEPSSVLHLRAEAVDPFCLLHVCNLHAFGEAEVKEDSLFGRQGATYLFLSP
jgi:hypothetical protein